MDTKTGAYGDNDPIDAIEIGDGPLAMGSVVTVKVLGSLELIDEEETDHKIIVLRSTDVHYHAINSIDDLTKYQPHVIKDLIHWLKNYKTSDGKPQNSLTKETPNSAKEAMEIIKEVHGFYQELVGNKVTDLEVIKGFELPSGKVAGGSASTVDRTEEDVKETSGSNAKDWNAE